MKLLIAEDNHDVAEVVAFSARLIWPACEVGIAGDGQTALRLFAEAAPDLVILDVGIPPPDGFEVCRRIRKVSTIPILMLSVHNGIMDKVRALDFGADDYLTKPFDHLELLARLRALARRSTLSPAPPAAIFTAGDVTIDFAVREVRVGGEMVPLTATEYRLLEELVRNAGAVVAHQTLLDRVWGPDHGSDASHLKVFIRRLRQKLGGDPAHAQYIQTEWGVGYRFVAPH